MITERGVRKSSNHCPHSMAFPAMISALKTFMGLPPRLRDIQAHGTTWKVDDDYFFQMGISAESFGLMYSTSHMLKSGIWNNQQIDDCFSAEGIEYRLFGNKSVPIKDANINPETITDEIIAHLLTDKPVILIHESGWHGGSCKLIIGYTDFGKVLLAHNGGKGVKISKTSKPHSNWQDKTFAVIFIDGLTQPSDRKAISLSALNRAYSMLNDNTSSFEEYGYGKHMWDKWLSRLENDNNFTFKSHAMRYITPEKFDLAERRSYGGDFFEQAQEILNEDLSVAIQSFRGIHDKMWTVHWMVSGENERKTFERATRNRVIDILKECQILDIKASEGIKQCLDKYKQPKPVKFDNHVNVIDPDGYPHNQTYLRRAKGLVKNGRAEWVDEKTIKILELSDETEEPNKIIEKYKYHCQHQAESFAKAIISVPKDYPLQAGLQKVFPLHFSKLCELAKDVYMDMSKQPEAYGLILIDIESKDRNLARNGYRAIHRFVDILSNLSSCGELKNHQLIVNAEEFRKSNKKGTGLVSGAVPKYELFFSRLTDFGFTFSDFVGKPYSKKVQFFTVEFPDYPEMIDTITTYCESWKLKGKEGVKIWPQEYHHHYYRFDYKITADREKIPMLQWINDEADYLGYSPEQKAFSAAFYKYSLQYKGVKFDGDYTYKSKRIARIMQAGYIAMGESNYLLHIKLKNMNSYMTEIDVMPESIKKLLAKDSCMHCGYQGATDDYCKFRVHWTFNGQSHEGCVHNCFCFDDFDVSLVPDYWWLLELEYGLKKV